MRLAAVTRLCIVTLVTLNLALQAQVPKPGSEGKRQLDWLSDYESATKLAESEKKPLLIDITTDWCGWSKKMERETFADKAVQKELRSFVLLRINPEASEKNDKLAKDYGVDGYPTLVVANFRGEELGNDSGYKNPKDLLEFLRRYEPLFKGNPLGYKPAHLDATDPLLKAIERIPAPDSRPTSVGAFIVLDQTDIQVQADGSAKMLVRTATFVSDPEKGDLPDAARHYVSSRQKARFKSVRVLDTKGEGREVDVKLAKDEHAYSNQNVYWDVRRLSLPVPTLKQGQILDVIEEIECQPIMPKQFYFRWNTGTKILLSSDLKITFPPSLKLQQRAMRCASKVSETQNGDGTLTWQLKTSNPEQYEPAPFSPPITEIWEGYEFFTPCSKDAIAGWFSGLCQGREVLPHAAKARVAELVKTNSTQTAQLQGLLDWITKDIRYVSVDFGASSHQPHPVSDTLTNLYGDCKDQSLLMQALCREAGIPAAIVLINAYGEPFNEQSPAIDQFNHCIVEATVAGKPYYLDPAAGPAKLGRVSHHLADTKGLKVEGSSGRTVTLPPYEPRTDEESRETLVKLNLNGSATITETVRMTGQSAVHAKERMKDTTPEKVRKYMEEAYRKSGRKLVDFFMTGTNAVGETYESRISYTAPRFGSRTAGGLVFKLGAQDQEEDWVATLNLPRTQSFRFRASDATKTTYTVQLPAGAELKAKPEDLELDTPFMKASRKLAFKDNKLSVSELSHMCDARLEAKESDKVYQAFRKLQEHRDYAFIVSMPSKSASEGQ